MIDDELALNFGYSAKKLFDLVHKNIFYINEHNNILSCHVHYLILTKNLDSYNITLSASYQSKYGDYHDIEINFSDIGKLWFYSLKSAKKSLFDYKEKMLRRTIFDL